MTGRGFTSWVKAHRFVAAGAVVVVAAGSVGVVTALAGDSSSGDDQEEYRPQIREELLDDVQLDPGCPDAEDAPAPGDGEVLISVARVVDGCLRYGSEVVPEDQVDDRLEERRAEPDVVAADRVVVRLPGGVGRSGRPAPGEPAPAVPAVPATSASRSPASRQADQPDQWALAPEQLDGDAVRGLWPAGAPEVRVAIIDTGIDDQHLDLTDQIAERAPWAHRYEGAYDNHGTHVAGIVAAADDGEGVVGLTPTARLMDVQYYDAGDEHLAGPSDDLGEYVRWAVDHGADVINMSIQGPDPSDTELTAILYAELRGVVVVGISGNCGGEGAGIDRPWLPDDFEDQNPCRQRNETKYPAGYDTVLSVANHTRDGERAETSSANTTVDIAAPGTDIWSTCLSEPSDMRHSCSADGTSMAAPYVAAAAALLKARHPDATPAAIREAIIRSARTEHHQPVDSRTDELGWGLLDPEAAARYLDEHPGGPQPAESPEAARTQAAFKDGSDNKIYAFDDGILHPVREIGAETALDSVDWSADRSQLVAAAGDQLILWNGPGSDLDQEVFEAGCDGCRAAVVERESGNELVAAIGNDNAIHQFDPDTLSAGSTVPLQLPNPDDTSVLYGDAGGHLIVAHNRNADSSGPDVLFLVDPLTGEQVARHGPDGNTQVGAVAVDADEAQVAYVGGQQGGPCGSTDQVYLLDGRDLSELSAPDLPTSDLGDLTVDDLFFNGDALYATMSATEAGGGGDYCTNVGSAGLWRLDDGGDGWTQIDTQPVDAVRPVEGMTDDPPTGRITIGEDRRGTFLPTGASGAEVLNLGNGLTGLQATPTQTEVDLARGASTPEITTTTTTRPSGGGGGPASDDVEGAIARFEQFMHALGERDLDTVCEIAGPAAQQAEDQGFGTCEETFGFMVDQLMSPEQVAAMRTATVDPNGVGTSASGGEVRDVVIPAAAIVADVTFTEDQLGDTVLSYQDGDWYIVD